ncbi:MAG: SDR family NAD(P)-dependent oxidoreductase [Candidatus Hodarchaeales archaeon]|jgi:3alpha(or 20beta)-hydroxysteroid dehydrogenase
MFSIEGKAAFITGGYQGIGLATAERFARAGARVVIVDVKDATKTAAEIGVHYVHADIANEDEVVKALEEAVQAIGKLDIVINNAAIDSYGPTIEEIDSELINKLTAVNYHGLLWCMKHAPRFMNNGGSIINNSSFAASIGFPGSGAYTSTKAASISLTRIAAQELGGRGIRVNVVCPGYINTSLGIDSEEHHAGATKNVETFTALGRWGTPDDVAGLFHYLASDDSSYISGQMIVIDGGWMAGPSIKLLEAVKHL